MPIFITHVLLLLHFPCTTLTQLIVYQYRNGVVDLVCLLFLLCLLQLSVFIRRLPASIVYTNFVAGIDLCTLVIPTSVRSTMYLCR